MQKEENQDPSTLQSIQGRPEYHRRTTSSHSGPESSLQGLSPSANSGSRGNKDNKLAISALIREETGKKVGLYRREGQVPAVIYGSGVKNQNLLLNYKDFEKIFKKAGSSSLIELGIDKQSPVLVLIQEVQKDPVSELYVHVDFQQVKMTEKISTEVNLNFIGESPAVKQRGGVLVKNISTIKIECLPKDLPGEFKVDISGLKTFDDIIRIQDLNISEAISIKEDDNRVVIKVQPPRTEEEIKALEETPEDKVEDIEKIGGDADEKAEDGEETEKKEDSGETEKSDEKDKK